MYSNPNERKINGVVVEKRAVRDVSLTSPEGRVVSDANDFGIGLAVGTLGLGGAVGAASAGFLGSQKNTVLAPTVRGECGGEEKKYETAWEYSVSVAKDETYTVRSAFSGFEVNECVVVFVSETEAGISGRIASGGDCRKQP